MQREKRLPGLSARKTLFAIAVAALAACAASPALSQSAADHYHKAIEQQKNSGNINKAIEEMKKAVEKDPETAAYRTALGELYFNNNNCAAATTEMKKAIQLDNNMFSAHTVLATCLALNGKQDEALAEYNSALALNAADAADTALILDRMGFIKHNQGKKDEAEASYKKAIETAPGVLDAYKHLGRLYYEENRLDEALQTCLKSVEIAPSDADARYNLSFIYAKSGKYQDALTQMDEALKIAPNDPGFLDSRRQLMAWAQKPPVYEAGELKGLPQEIVAKTPINNIYGVEPAEKQPESTPAIIVETIPSPPQQTQPVEPAQPVNIEKPAQIEKPEKQAVAIKQPEPKREKKRRAKKEEPAEAKPKRREPTREELAAEYFTGAKYNLGANLTADAITDIKRALALFPENPDYLTAYGLAIIQQGDPEASLEQFNLALKQNPSHSAALNSRGYANYLLGRRDESEGDFLGASAADPNNGCAAANVAASLAAKTDCGDKENEASLMAIENRCLRAAVQNNMALCSLAGGDADRAKYFTYKALKMEPKNRVILANYSFLVQKTGSAADGIVVKEKTPEPYYQAGPGAGDIPLAALTPVVTLDFVNVFNDNWNARRVLVMPFENPRGVRKWRKSPSESFTSKIVESLGASGYLTVVTPDRDREYTYEELKDPALISKLAKKYKADLVFIGRLSRPTLSQNSEKKLLGLKKKNTLQASIVMDTLVLDASTLTPIYKGNVEGESELSGVEEGELSYYQSTELAGKAFSDYCSNVSNEILDYYNLLRREADNRIVRFTPESYEYQKNFHW